MQNIALQIPVQNYFGRAGCFKRPRIVFLMILRRIRIGNQDCRNPTRGEFGKACCPGPVDHQIRHSHSLRHIVKVGLYFYVWRLGQIHALCLQAADDVLVIELARDMQILHLTLLGRLDQHIHHSVIDAARATAAAGNQHRFFRRVKAKGLGAFLSCRREHVLADGIAGAGYLACRKMLLRLRRARRNTRDELGKNLVGDARHHILLLNQRRNPEHTGRHEYRPADIAARTNDRIGLELTHHVHGLGHAHSR